MVLWLWCEKQLKFTVNSQSTVFHTITTSPVFNLQSQSHVYEELDSDSNARTTHMIEIEDWPSSSACPASQLGSTWTSYTCIIMCTILFRIKEASGRCWINFASIWVILKVLKQGYLGCIKWWLESSVTRDITRVTPDTASLFKNLCKELRVESQESWLFTRIFSIDVSAKPNKW